MRAGPKGSSAIVKIGIVSDIHCNAPGLERALELMGDVDEVLCAGDSVYEYRWSNEVIEILRNRQARLVLGNHENVLLGSQGQRARQMPTVNQGLVDYLREQPYRIETRLNGKRLLMVHGSPFDPWNEYVYAHTRTFQRLSEVDADYVVLGHTHMPMAERSGKVLVVNPGSAGEARDPRLSGRLSFAVLDTQSDEVRIESYDNPLLEDIADRG